MWENWQPGEQLTFLSVEGSEQGGEVVVVGKVKGRTGTAG